MKLKLLYLFTLFNFLAFSQTPIANYDSANGSEYAIISTVVDNSTSGTNAIWNFTGLTKTGDATDAYASPTAQELIDYPNTTYVFTSVKDGTTGKVFAENNSGAISLTGVEGEGLILRYNDNTQGGNALIGTFPLSYGTAATVDNVAGTFTYVPFTIDGTFFGTITSEVDAYGTLTVNGTDVTSFSGAVTRLKVVQDLTMSVANGNINQETYNYYDDSTGDLVFRTSTLAITSSLINDTTVVTESLTEVTLGVDQRSISKSSLNIYPNPVKNDLNFSLSENIKTIGIEVYDITGRQIVNKDADTNYLNVSELNTGIYIMTVLTNNGRVSRKFIKE
ncbi:hypothetical protein DIS18_00290 [Algibacter marinivivus]|uniref:Secretion system C-terminal sorting domain-containing protein n=1 Tax=Algibacter marinivivus TaxID=2100723 RepID=A0A2U2X5L1_9FLAO|nr:T9SS type A sorting domain-containing protein [Algibacter marinivivus]PWH83030.1 hypothetical protein DIS18_00290 [Algibacter marinivivus]